MLQQFSRKVAQNLPEAQAKFDPTIILLIMELIAGFLPTIMELCNKEPEDVISMAAKPTGLQQRILRMRVRRNMGRRAFRDGGDEIVNSLLVTTSDAKPEEILEIYDTL